MKEEENALKLSRLQKDALGEIGNIGAGKAAVALSKFLARDVSMSLPELEIIKKPPIESFKQELFSKNDIALITLSTIKPSKFDLFCVIEKESVDKLLRIMIKNPEIKPEMSQYHPIYKSLIKEVGSILLIQYVSALNKHLKIENILTYPNIYFGKLKQCLEKAKNKGVLVCDRYEKTITVRLRIFTVEENISFELIISPCGYTVSKFLEALNIP